MRAHLKRNLWLGEVQYVASEDGVEIPDLVGGKRVVFAGDPDKKADDIVLPKDAVPFEHGMVGPRDALIKNAGTRKAVALSEMHRRANPPLADI